MQQGPAKCGHCESVMCDQSKASAPGQSLMLFFAKLRVHLHCYTHILLRRATAMHNIGWSCIRNYQKTRFPCVNSFPCFQFAPRILQFEQESGRVYALRTTLSQITVPTQGQPGQTNDIHKYPHQYLVLTALTASNIHRNQKKTN